MPKGHGWLVYASGLDDVGRWRYQVTVPPRLGGIAEIAALFGVSPETVSRWRYRHKNPPRKPPWQPFPKEAMTIGRSPLYDLEELKAWGHATGRLRSAGPDDELDLDRRVPVRAVVQHLEVDHWMTVTDCWKPAS
ncbi:MAG TPA: helix-turn-helix domain-containing protein [Actinomycetes bacterium]|nr:helix-turn-helix domain-containing protein [Actinomycetes bacterium]